MAYNGSGTFLINTAGQPVVAGTVISSTTFNALTADLATGLSTVITKDGQTTVTANIPMASFKFTGLGVGSAAGDSANLSQVQSTVTKLLASVSGADTVTATASPTLAAYAAGQMFYFVAAGDNTTSVTLNIDSLGAKAVTRDGSVALAAADIKSGEVVVVVYDGTRFQVVSQLNSAGNATFANVSITSALNVGGVATFSAGSAAAPSITTTGDTNTGIFFPAADTIGFTEGGVESMRIDSSANVGIGTASPGQKLEVAGNIFVNTSGNPYAEIKTSGSGNNPSLKLTADTNSWTFQGTFSNANDDLLVLYNATTLLDLTKDGNLGIGTTSPTERLDVRNGGLVVGNGTIKTVISYASEGIVGTTSNHALLLYANNTERARITSGGVYLVGTTNTAGSAGVGIKLHPDGLVSTVSTTSITDSYNYYNETAGAYRFYVTNGGTVFATNTTISAISDQRLKENIRDLDAGLDAVMALKPRKFDWKAGKGKDKKDDRGFIAQEFEQVFPDLIDTWKDQAPEGEEPYKSVRQDLMPVLVKAIQEQQAIITDLTARLTALESK